MSSGFVYTQLTSYKRAGTVLRYDGKKPGPGKVAFDQVLTASKLQIEKRQLRLSFSQRSPTLGISLFFFFFFACSNIILSLIALASFIVSSFGKGHHAIKLYLYLCACICHAISYH